MVLFKSLIIYSFLANFFYVAQRLFAHFLGLAISTAYCEPIEEDSSSKLDNLFAQGMEFHYIALILITITAIVIVFAFPF